MDFTKKIAFIGAGKMATAIALGLRKGGLALDCVTAYDVSSAASAAFTAATGYPAARSMTDAVASADLALLAVKPQYALEALSEAKSALAGKLLISIAAGLPIAALSKAVSSDRVIRVMPNTPALVGEGMSCYAPGPGAGAEDLMDAEYILKACGRARQVPERLLDAVTGLSGSGPAYVLEFIMGLADGGVYCGLPRDLALESAAQTVFGTAAMILRTKSSPADLRDAVISPAGTTARGIRVLQQGAFKGVTADAVIAGAERSAELGKSK